MKHGEDSGNAASVDVCTGTLELWNFKSSGEANVYRETRIVAKPRRACASNEGERFQALKARCSKAQGGAKRNPGMNWGPRQALKGRNSLLSRPFRARSLCGLRPRVPDRASRALPPWASLCRAFGASLLACLSLRLRIFARLVKINIAIASTLSAATGYFIRLGVADSGMLTSIFGVFLVALGSCALNQFQDRKIDVLMQRTRRRPIPAGELKPVTALGIAVILVVIGLSFLALYHGLTVATTALLAVLLYNGFYTYLKRTWAFAAVPGALIGALPPMIGWMAAGGDILDPRIIALAFFFFIWQVPHFWLLLFIYGEEYESAGFPSMTRALSRQQCANLTFIWLLTAAASVLLFPLYGMISSPWTCLALLACCLWLAGKSIVILRRNLAAQSSWPIFRSINAYALCIMVLLVADSALSK
jgi:heme o synthase